jgi:hypothetical protein
MISFDRVQELVVVLLSKRWLLGLACLSAALGCESPEGIRSYSVRKEPPPNRMLAAIIPVGGEVWFFKMTGSNNPVNALAEQFESFIKSVRFAEGPSGEPQWKLPPGWTQQSGNEMRFATILIETNVETVECTVSKLGLADQSLKSLDDFLMANINRWRGQLRLVPIDVAELPKESKRIQLDDPKLYALTINYAGELSAGAMGSAPFAKSTPNFTGKSAPPSSSSAAKVTFEAPTGWSQGELEISRGGISVRRDAAFEVKDQDRRIEITVTKLPAGAGATLPNVNRWRGQIGLPDFSAEQLEKEKKQIEFAGKPADYVQFSGEGQAVLGVLAERNGLLWFVKLQGDSELAERERQKFEGFVQSIRLN